MLIVAPIKKVPKIFELELNEVHQQKLKINTDVYKEHSSCRWIRRQKKNRIYSNSVRQAGSLCSMYQGVV